MTSESDKPIVFEELMTIHELAAHFKVTAPTIRNWELKGEIPSYRKGRFVRFRLSEVLEAMKPSTDPFAQSAGSLRAWRKDGNGRRYRRQD